MSTRFLFFFCVIISVFLCQCNTILSSTSSTTNKGATNSSSTSKFRQDLVSFAKQQQGVNYKYAGRNPRSGFDCSGFTHYVYDEFDINLTPVSRVQETEGRKISLNEVKAGDLVFFRRTRAGSVFHVALVVKHDGEGISVVHSTSSRGVIVENITKSSYWNPKLSSARRFIFN